MVRSSVRQRSSTAPRSSRNSRDGAGTPSPPLCRHSCRTERVSASSLHKRRFFAVRGAVSEDSRMTSTHVTSVMQALLENDVLRPPDAPSPGSSCHTSTPHALVRSIRDNSMPERIEMPFCVLARATNSTEWHLAGRLTLLCSHCCRTDWVGQNEVGRRERSVSARTEGVGANRVGRRDESSQTAVLCATKGRL